MSITPIKHFETKQDAINYVSYEKKLLSPNSLNSVLTRVGIFRACKIISETDGHPAQDAMLALFDPKTDKLNFIEGDSTGDAQIQMLDSLIGAGITQVVGANTVNVSTQLAVAKPLLLHECNKPYQPYKDITEHTWQLEKGIITRTAIAPVNGIATITTSADCELHVPHIYRLINNVFYKRVSSFGYVDKAGVYHTECPQINDLYVDNAYGVI